MLVHHVSKQNLVLFASGRKFIPIFVEIDQIVLTLKCCVFSHTPTHTRHHTHTQHTTTHISTHTPTHRLRDKMADGVNEQIEDALNTIVKLTDQSGNIKKDLKKSIDITVSKLRNLIFILKAKLIARTSENSLLQKEVTEMKKKELEAHRNPHTTGLLAPSCDSTTGLTRAENVTSTPPRDGKKTLRLRFERKKWNAIQLNS